MVLKMPQAAVKAASLVNGPTPYNEPGWCQHWCSRDVYDDQGPYYWGGNHSAWAINMWYGAVERGRVVKTSDPTRIPAGAMTFSKGSSQYGHVFIGDGMAGCYSTDYPRSRYIGHPKIRDLLTSWGHTLLGYIEVTGAGTDFRGTSTAPIPALTVWDQLSWNVAEERWYTEWDNRQVVIGNSIRGDASVNFFQECRTDDQVEDLMRALGANFTRMGAPAGLDGAFDKTRWDFVGDEKLSTGVQGRYLQKVQLRRKATGRLIVFGNTHAPALDPDLRVTFGNKIAPWIRDIDVLNGDFNTGKDYLAPRSNIEAAGFRHMRDQCDVKNEGMAEFPTKAKWLADIYSRPDHKVKITYGELHLTTAMESDHRELTARLEAR